MSGGEPIMTTPADAQPAAGSVEAPARRRLRIVSKVVMAMRRFQASLNPKIDVGRRRPSGDTEQVSGNQVFVQRGADVAGAAGTTASGRASGRTTSGRTSSGRPTSANHHGHKAGLLFRPLPKVEQEVVN